MNIKLKKGVWVGFQLRSHQHLEISKAVRLDEINRQVNETKKGQKTKD